MQQKVLVPILIVFQTLNEVFSSAGFLLTEKVISPRRVLSTTSSYPLCSAKILIKAFDCP